MPRREWRRGTNRLGFLTAEACRIVFKLNLPKMWRLLNDSWCFHLCQSPHEETFSTWKIILSSKCFSSPFERSLFHDPLDYESIRRSKGWAPRLTHRLGQPSLQKRAYSATNLQSARAVMPTNFYADDQYNTRWASNWKLKNELRRAYVFVHELIRGWN